MYAGRLRFRACAVARPRDSVSAGAINHDAARAGDARAAVYYLYAHPALDRYLLPTDRAFVFRQRLRYLFAAPVFQNHTARTLRRGTRGWRERVADFHAGGAAALDTSAGDRGSTDLAVLVERFAGAAAVPEQQ